MKKVKLNKSEHSQKNGNPHSLREVQAEMFGCPFGPTGHDGPVAPVYPFGWTLDNYVMEDDPDDPNDKTKCQIVLSDDEAAAIESKYDGKIPANVMAKVKNAKVTEFKAVEKEIRKS